MESGSHLCDSPGSAGTALGGSAGRGTCAGLPLVQSWDPRRACPDPSLKRLPTRPDGFCLGLTPLEHSGAVARTSGRSPTQLGAARRMLEPRRDRPRSRGGEQQGRGTRGSQPTCDWTARLYEHEFLLASGGVGQGSRGQSQLRALGLERSRTWIRLLEKRGGGWGGRRGGGRSRGLGAGAGKNGRRARAQAKEKQ